MKTNKTKERSSVVETASEVAHSIPNDTSKHLIHTNTR